MNIADGEIGITTDFESVVPGSSPGPRTAGSGVLDCTPGLAVATSRAQSAPRGAGANPAASQLSFPSPCRLCGGPSWLADELAAIHPCCQLMWDGSRCVSCDASERLNRERERRKPKPWKESKGVD